MNDGDRIDLAREPDFRLGRLSVRPGTRELVCGGESEVLEPRVMQVLVALTRANGAIVGRDDLTRTCWEGRVVGEDAINRVISRLRRAAHGVGEDSFRVETITKVGYRLVPADGGGPVMQPEDTSPTSRDPTVRLTRRGVAAGAVAAAALGGVGWLSLRPAHGPTPDVGLLDQAWQSWTQGTDEGVTQAIGLYRRAVERAPGHADAWGFLACAYADRAQSWASTAEQPGMRERAREAGRRALQLDPRNALGRAAIAYAQPVLGNWATMEREFRRAIRDQPEKWLVTYSLALLLTHVGRLSEAADLFGQLRNKAPTAAQYFFHVRSLWGSGRIGEAERLLEEATTIYAGNSLIWQTRFDMAMHEGRPAKAIALARDIAPRPEGERAEWLAYRVAVAEQVMRRDPTASEAVVGDLMRQAREASWHAARAIQDLAILGRVDEAFSVADAYFFSRGFAVPDEPPATQGAAVVTLAERSTGFLFLPPLRTLWADPRFAGLVDRLGLARYWRSSRSRPDYFTLKALPR